MYFYTFKYILNTYKSSGKFSLKVIRISKAEAKLIALAQTGTKDAKTATATITRTAAREEQQGNLQ